VWQVVICNRTHHAVTFLDQWAGGTGWEAVTLAPGQAWAQKRMGAALPLEVLYQVNTQRGPRERLAILPPASSFELPWVYSFHPGPRSKISLS
jgi:hypothetical protein